MQLDHASDLRVILESVAAGADAVLADGSSLPYEDNIALVREVRAALDEAGAADVVIEAELGGLAGDEDKAFGAERSAHDAGASVAGLTNPAQVADFVERTGAQLLAVAVGNVHGKYKGEPNIRWDVLQEVAAETEVPLVLHGASGIPADELAKAPSMQVGKVNFNTELRTGILSMLESQAATHRPMARIFRVCWPSGIARLQLLRAPHWSCSAPDGPRDHQVRQPGRLGSKP